MTPDKTKIRNAATIIVVRNKKKNPSVLMGQRGINAAFMPSKFVFPGGAVDDEDLLINFENPINDVCKARLKKENKNVIIIKKFFIIIQSYISCHSRTF